MNALTSGCGGKNYGTEIRTVGKLKTQELNGVSTGSTSEDDEDGS